MFLCPSASESHLGKYAECAVLKVRLSRSATNFFFWLLLYITSVGFSKPQPRFCAMPQNAASKGVFFYFILGFVDLEHVYVCVLTVSIYMTHPAEDKHTRCRENVRRAVRGGRGGGGGRKKNLRQSGMEECKAGK